MKAIVISKNAKEYTFIKDCIANTKGVSNLEVDIINNKFIFDFSTHNIIEGLREKLIAFGFVVEFIY
ncbi:hypothetical protein [Lacinutrix sp. Bg11-31]|uniref:hypothetical protein n=1 Tax=Lacinutrix sp. Bg11-31 TaxID=2057808 RepID=UPI000C30CADF|nr:hypothetical protein [Lacinutrix sp. Bg11-31]AUC81117.1 hypothetical protein CW733_02810 [Lacinutrix sp. Bg11-31]